MNRQNSQLEKNRKYFEETINKKTERRLNSQRNGEHKILFGLGMFGLIGWSVAIPTLIGIACGIWLDKFFNDRISWTLTLLFVGLVLGCLNAWHWIKREGNTAKNKGKE